MDILEKQKKLLDQVEFDETALATLTVVDWAAHLDVITDMSKTNQEHVDHWATLLAKVVKSLPGEWGDPKDPQSYKNLPMFTGLNAIQGMFNEAVDEIRKKVRSLYTTA